MEQVAIIGKRRREYQLPSGYDEVRPEDWPRIMPYLLLHDDAQTRTLLLFNLLRDRKGNRIKLGNFRRLSSDQILQLFPLIEWIYTDRPTSPPFPHISLPEHGDMLLPNAELKYISLIEYAVVDFFYHQYAEAAIAGQQEQASEYFHRVVGYLCRPRARGVDPTDASTFKGDLREQFNTSICDERMPAWQKLSYEAKLPVMLFFAGCKALLHQRFKGSVFFSEIDEKTGEKVQGVKAAGPQAWIDLVYQLAGPRYGTIEQTMYTPLDTILYDLQLQNRS